MEMEVKVNMKTKVEPDGSGQTADMMEQQYLGRWMKKGNAWYLQYQESAEEMGDTASIIKVEPGKLTVIRRGDVSMRQEYREGVCTRGTYGGPFGSMLMETDTKRLAFDCRNEDGVAAAVAVLDWVYVLYLNENRVGTYHTRIELKEVT